MPETNILCGPGLGQKSKPNQRPVEEAVVAEVEKRLSRVLQNAGKELLLLKARPGETRTIYMKHLDEEIAECRAHKGVQNTSAALRNLGLEEYVT